MQMLLYNHSSYCSVFHSICQCTVAIKQYCEAIAITILNDNKQFNIKYWINHFLTATTVYVLWFLFLSPYYLSSERCARWFISRACSFSAYLPYNLLQKKTNKHNLLIIITVLIYDQFAVIFLRKNMQLWKGRLSFDFFFQ